MCLTLLKKVCVGVRPPFFPSRPPPSPVVNPMPTLYVILVNHFKYCYLSTNSRV